jgi:Ran GTPase-activating protein (RanGAP) involved in mRNA processing and transport
MATATHVQLTSSPSLTIRIEGNNAQTTAVDMNEAIRLAALCRTSLNILANDLSILDTSHPYTAGEILQLPLAQHRAPDELYSLPARKSSRHQLAQATAALLDPSHEGSLTAIIRYDADRVRLRGWAALQRKYDLLVATRRNGNTTMGMAGGSQPGVAAPVWSSRIIAQGRWDPSKRPISLAGVPAIPMPVKVAQEMELAPFLGHLGRGGTHELDAGSEGFELDGGRGEPYYGVKAAEFQKGVVYEDGRMDLCKMVVGPDHIWRLMDSLRSNTFVRHFLLGNNIIGPTGALAIASFITDLPDQMDTWYLAGNCIDGPSFKILVDALVKSPAVTNIWLKRNPLGPSAAHDVFRLITETENLRTLDLDQTELGDQGIAELFLKLAAYRGPEGTRLPLRHIYMSGCGISTKAVTAIGEFLQSPHCGITSCYMESNPLGNEGAQTLASALPKAPYLTRLLLQSVGVSTKGAIALCEALSGHPSLRALDLGQAYATEDLGQAYNYIEDGALPAIWRLLRETPRLEYFNLAHCPIEPRNLRELSVAVQRSPSLLYYQAISILPDPENGGFTFTPSRDQVLRDPGTRSVAQIQTDNAVRERLERNVRVKYGEDMTYTRFLAEERRWLTSDKLDVRKIDSVYRNRDAGLARRRLAKLVKNWNEDDDTLERVKNAVVGPTCSLRRR